MDTKNWTEYEFKVLREHTEADHKVLAEGINKWIAQDRPQLIKNPSETWRLAMELYKLGETK